VVADITDRGDVATAVRGGAFDAVCHLAAVTQVRESFELRLQGLTPTWGTSNVLPDPGPNTHRSGLAKPGQGSRRLHRTPDHRGLKLDLIGNFALA
jgi:hypothetical protein